MLVCVYCIVLLAGRLGGSSCRGKRRKQDGGVEGQQLESGDR